MDEEVYSKSRRDGVTNCLSTVPLVEMRPIHLSTLLAPRLSCLLSYINSLSRRFAGKEHTIFFVLSANFESSNELEGAVSALRAMGLGETGHKGRSKVVGCLSGSLSEVDIPGLKGRCGLSCAIAIFDSARCVPFYSGLPGRKEVQVGRWHSFRKTEAGEENGGVNVGMRGGNGDGKRVDWEELWNRRTSSGADLLPEELRSIPSVVLLTWIYFLLNPFMLQSLRNSLTFVHVSSSSRFIHISGFRSLFINLNMLRPYCCSDSFCYWPSGDTVL